MGLQAARYEWETQKESWPLFLQKSASLHLSLGCFSWLATQTLQSSDVDLHWKLQWTAGLQRNPSGLQRKDSPYVLFYAWLWEAIISLSCIFLVLCISCNKSVSLVSIDWYSRTGWWGSAEQSWLRVHSGVFTRGAGISGTSIRAVGWDVSIWPFNGAWFQQKAVDRMSLFTN